MFLNIVLFGEGRLFVVPILFFSILVFWVWVVTYLFSPLQLNSQALTSLLLPVLVVTSTIQAALLGDLLCHALYIWPKGKCSARFSYHRLFSV